MSNLCELNEQAICRRCKRRAVSADVRRICTVLQRWQWGDAVAGVLTRAGFRKCGGCARRQRQLNELGRTIGGLIDERVK